MAEKDDNASSLAPNTPVRFQPQIPRYQCRHLMIDVYFALPDGCDDKFLKHEAFFKLRQRFEKLVRYVKFYIKGKQEKRVYLTPRQRERDRLELIDEVLIFSPYIPPIPIFDIQTPDVGTFDCKASELQPSFLINTLGKACQNQRVAPDKTTQIADDLTRFYEEIFIPEGGVPQLQHNPMEHHFLWVCAEFDREDIMLYYSRIILVLASSNGSKPGSEPTVHIMWSINTTSSNAVDLVEFEHFYDEKADGFKRNAKSLSSDAGIRLEKWRSGTRDWRLNRTRAPGNINLTQEGGSITQPKKDQVAEVLEAQEELVQRDMVDNTLGKKK